jgi:accessory colonization factor AcfC
LKNKQVKLAEMLEQEGVDIIQTEGGKCSNPSKSGVLGLIEKVTQKNLIVISFTI